MKKRKVKILKGILELIKNTILSILFIGMFIVSGIIIENAPSWVFIIIGLLLIYLVIDEIRKY